MDLLQPGQLLGIGPQDGAADAGVFVDAGGAEVACADAEGQAVSPPIDNRCQHSPIKPTRSGVQLSGKFLGGGVHVVAVTEELLVQRRRPPHVCGGGVRAKA